jgi:outer membrane immunogenic protein
MTWTGAYVGINGGAIWTNSRNFTTTGTDFGGTGTPVISAVAALTANNKIPTGNRTQFLVGGTWGYNWQLNNWVLGTESDFQGVFGCRNGNNNGFFGNNNGCGGVATGVGVVGAVGAAAPFGVQTQQAVSRSLDYLSTSRVRAGFLVTPSLLVYGTGGIAIGRVRVNSAINTTFTGAVPGAFFPGLSTANYSQLKAGFVAGGGLEWMFFKDWSFKAEALYYDLGRSTLNQQVQVVAGGPAAGLLLTNTGINTTWRNNGIIARGGLNYHLHWFDAAPVVARY